MITRRPYSVTRILFSLAIFLSLFSAHGAATGPIPVVERFHNALLGTMKEAEALGVKGRYERLAPEISEAFNLPLMIRVASGSFWKKASPAQQEQLVAAFGRLSVSTYASQFDGYSGQLFETTGERPGPQETRLVETRLMRPNGDPVPLTYVLKMDGDRWRIADVLLESGISELAVRRSEYRRVLKSEGIEGLIRTLNEKASVLMQEKG